MSAATENIVVERNKGSWLAIFIVFFVAICVFGFSASVYLPAARYVTIAILVITTLVVLLPKTPVQSEINPQDRSISILYRSHIGKTRKQCYPLDEYQSVRTYFVASKNYANYLVVLSAEDKPSLTIAEFEATGEWSTRSQIEGDDARALREEIARKCSLKDDGFRGNRWQWKG